MNQHKNDPSFNIGGIKCDNPSCKYEDPTAKFEDYDKYLNKPCPDCGSNLLTQADLDAAKLLMKIVNHPLNKLYHRIAAFFGSKPVTKHVEFNGTGVVKFTDPS